MRDTDIKLNFATTFQTSTYLSSIDGRIHCILARKALSLPMMPASDVKKPNRSQDALNSSVSDTRTKVRKDLHLQLLLNTNSQCVETILRHEAGGSIRA